MIPLLLLVTLFNLIASIDHESFVKSDGTTYIDIESSLTPHSNMSYGFIQILNEIAIQFDLIYHEQNYTSNQLNAIQNIFRLQSIKSMDTANIIYCSHYPSMWFTPIDNSLYFSLFHDVYCLEIFNPITPNIPYSITIQYDSSTVYIGVNNTTLLNESHHLPFDALNHNIDTLKLWISDTVSDPAPVTLYNVHIKTSITTVSTQAPEATDPTRPVVNRIQSTTYITTHSDTVFIIEMAVLSVFAFSCLGVIVASMCLWKMRSTAKCVINAKKRHSVSSRLNKFKSSTQCVAINIHKAKPPKKSYKVVDINKNMSKTYSYSQEEYALPMTPRTRTTAECKTEEKDNFADVLSIEYSTLSKCFPEEDHMYKHQQMEQQIPKYDSSATSSGRSLKINGYSVTPMILIDPKVIAECVDLPQSPDSIDPEIIKDIYDEQLAFDNDMMSIESTEPTPSEMHMDDAYDLNSDEDDVVKLRRAAIQSTRAVVEAFNIQIEPFEAPSDYTDRDDDAAVINSIYDTIHRKPISISSSSNCGSIEEMYGPSVTANTKIIAPIIEPGSCPSSSVAGVAGSAPPQSLGPSIPSLATDITSNRYSTHTNTTFLTDATKRLMLPGSEDAKTTSSLYNNMTSSFDDLSHLSSDDESTIITIPKGKRKSNSLSALSFANTIHQISENYNHLGQSDSSSTGKIQLSKSKSLSDNNILSSSDWDFNQSKSTFLDESDDDDDTMVETEHKDSQVSSVIVDRIKMMRKKYSMELSDTDDMSKTMSAAYRSVKVYSGINSANMKLMGRGLGHSLSITESSETSENEKEFEWIKFALKECDENGWDKYFENFKKHKVNESRLRKLADGDWKDLIPEIGPRNDFKELWRIRCI